MKQTLTTEQAIDLLLAAFRDGWKYEGERAENEYAGWTPAGARALVEHLEEMEEQTGEEMELDVVALRCEYTPFPTAVEAADSYDAQLPRRDEETALEWLRERTIVIEHDDGVVMQAF